MKPPPAALQVACTASGLRALNVPSAVIESFSPEFLAGMAEENRARRLGDIGSNAPSKWEWGYGVADAPDLIVMFFADAHGLSSFIERATGITWRAAFEELRWLGTADRDGVEPFGFG